MCEKMDFLEAMDLNEAIDLAAAMDLNVDAMEDHLPVQEDKLSVGKLKHGCKHYRRRCRIRAPCCNEIFDCRHCHNEAKNSNEVEDSKRHDIPRHRVEKTEKEQYHCDACGICRIGGRDNFFHCDRCGSCYTIALQNSHPCVENAMHQNCPVCVEYLFDSVMDISVLPCGHTMHRACLRQMTLHSQFCCPICSKSIQDMSRFWHILDQEVNLTPMPEEYRHKRVWVLCNDCGTTSDVKYHVIGHKCAGCGSYNTRSTNPPRRISSSPAEAPSLFPLAIAAAPEMVAE